MSKIEVLMVAQSGLEPTYAHAGDAGLDLKAAADMQIQAHKFVTVPTGVALALPVGYVALVHPRSGLAAKNGITVLNAPGTVDAGYRGEIAVTLINHSDQDFSISRGDRIAQLVIQEVARATLVAVEQLPDSARGSSGFGSTGVR